MKTYFRVLFSLSAIMMFLIMLFTGSASAGNEYRIKERVLVASDEIIEGDLIIAGNSILIEGRVKGNVVAIGGEITLTGHVEKNLLVAGQVLYLRGHVDGNVRFTGQSFIIEEGAVSVGNVKVAAYSLVTRPQSRVGDVRFFGYQALIGGRVNGSFKGAMRAFELAGDIGGNVRVKVGKTPKRHILHSRLSASTELIPYVQPGLVITDSASIKGMLVYESSGGGYIDPLADIEGQIILDGKIFGEDLIPFLVSIGTTGIRRFITYLLIGLILVMLYPYWLRRLAETVIHHTWASFGYGILMIVGFVILLFGIPALTITLSIILGKFSLGGALLFVIGLGILLEVILSIGFLIYIAFVPQIIFSFLSGRWILRRMNHDWNVGRIIPLFIGILLFVILTSIPVIGLAISIIVPVLGLGAVWKLRTANPYVTI